MPAPKDPKKRKKWIENIQSGTKLAMSRPEVKEKISGKNHPMYGKKHTKETLEKNRLANSGTKNGMYGKIGNQCAQFKGNKYQNKEGRWLVWIDGKRITQSRYIAEKYLKRKLMFNEVVHHINEDKSDDRPENLYIFPTPNEHDRHHGWKNKPILISNLII